MDRRMIFDVQRVIFDLGRLIFNLRSMIFTRPTSNFSRGRVIFSLRESMAGTGEGGQALQTRRTVTNKNPAQENPTPG